MSGGRAGVFLSEIDLSQTIGASTGVYSSIQITAPKGETEKLILVGRDLKLRQEFTPDETIKIGYDNAFWSALSYLQKSNKLWVSRVVNKASYSSVSLYSLEYADFTGTNKLTSPVLFDANNLWFTTKSNELKSQLQTGSAVRFATGSNLPSPLVAGTTYFIYQLAVGKYQLATTYEEAIATVPVLIDLVPVVNVEVSTFTASTDIVTLASTDLDSILVTGSKGYFTNTGGAVPTGLLTNIDYYVKRLANDSFLVCTTLANSQLPDIVATTNFAVNPTHFTISSHGLLVGNPLKFTNTGGALPTGITANTTYYAKTIIDADTVEIATTIGGVVVSVSDDGTGTHKATSGFIDFTSNGTGASTFTSRADLLNHSVSTPLSKGSVFSESTLTFNATTDTVTLPTNSGILNKLGLGKICRFKNTGGSLPIPLEANMDYFLIDPNIGDQPNTNYVFQLAYTIEDAIAGIPINLLTAGTGTTTLKVKLDDPESYSFDNFECLNFYAKDQGVWGDAYAVKLLDNRTELPDSFIVEVYKAPDFVTPIERPFVCSRIVNKKDGFNRNIYIEEVMKRSSYVRCNDNSLIDQSVFPLFQSQPIRLIGGDDGDQVTTGQLIQDLNAKFTNTNRIANTVFMDGGRAYVGNTAYAKELLRISQLRGDSVAVLSTPLDAELNSDFLNALIDYKRNDLNANSSWGGVYTPHLKIYDSYNDRNDFIISPDGIIAGLISQADSVYKRWFPVAGKTRGKIEGIEGLVREFDSTDLDELYRNGINPIKLIEGEGIYLWGQKTLLNIASALDRMNVRLLITVLGPTTVKALDNFVFEFNDELTRQNIIDLLTVFYSGVQSDRGLYDFKIFCGAINNDLTDYDNYTMNVWIFIKPEKGAEFIPTKLIVTRTSLDFSLAAQLI